VELDHQKIDDAVLALLFLTSFQSGPVQRAWKGQDWDAMERLFEAGLICDPKSKAKSIVFTEEGQARAKALFESLFCKPS
jgi:hypothetical protein